MRQVIGYTFIICSTILLLFLVWGIHNEVTVAEEHATQIENNIDLPEVSSQLPVTMLDGNGNVFSEEYVEWRQPLKLQEIPEVAKKVFLLSEDKEYYNHIGFNITAIMRAIVSNSASESQQGGSTITQQLVRMRYLTADKTYERKLMEIFYSYELEKMYDKNTILEFYLNEMYFSNRVYGIGAAATYYFQKPLNELSIAEIAFISAIPNNPTLYDPLKNFENTKLRQERLLNVLAEHRIISQEELEAYKQEPITLNVKQKLQNYPAYNTYVLDELQDLVATSEGLKSKYENATSNEEKAQIQNEINTKVNQLYESGIVIHTALNPEKQTQDEQKINSLLTRKGLQASAVVIDNDTREIVSMYGGKNYKKYDFHRAYQAPRQPGSAFKPLIVYAPLFETTNYTPNSIVTAGRYCVGNFCPKNYGGAVYGNVTIRTAFQHSFNTSVVYLLQKVGIDTAFQYLDRFNFESIVDSDKTYAASLGGLTYGVTTLELADAFTSFIDGSYVQAHSIRKITDLNGNELYSWPKEREAIWSQHTVNYMRQLLNRVVTSGTGRGLRTTTSYIGAKTGTTNDNKDYWLAGLTENYTTAVWIGYDEPRDMGRLGVRKVHFNIFNAITD